jgi:hypothetical protein
MTQKHHLHYVLVADSSSSMDCQIDEVRDEINIQIAKLRDESDPELRPCTFTFRTFNSEMKNVHVNLPIHKVPKIEEKHYEAEGLTALFDAIGSSIVTTDKMIGHRLDGINESLVIVIFSDGGENASKEFDAKIKGALGRDVATPFLIQGPRGEKKRISCDRALVEFSHRHLAAHSMGPTK